MLRHTVTIAMIRVWFDKRLVALGEEILTSSTFFSQQDEIASNVDLHTTEQRCYTKDARNLPELQMRMRIDNDSEEKGRRKGGKEEAEAYFHMFELEGLSSTCVPVSLPHLRP